MVSGQGFPEKRRSGPGLRLFPINSFQTLDCLENIARNDLNRGYKTDVFKKLLTNLKKRP
jgi:hypothetical protein